MSSTRNRNAWIGSLGLVVTGVVTLVVAAAYEGHNPTWVPWAEGSLFIVSAILLITGFRQEKTNAGQH